jgi:DNA repair protein RadA/Sms
VPRLPVGDGFVHSLLTVVDSIQTVHSPEAGAVPGSPNQIKFCSQEFVEWAKSHDSIVVLVAHVTKDGMIAGPKAESFSSMRCSCFEQAENALRVAAHEQERFGSSDELGFFLMGEGGLTELADPSGIFMVRREGQLPEVIAVAIVHEGSRILSPRCRRLRFLEVGYYAGVFGQDRSAARVADCGGARKADEARFFEPGDICECGGGPPAH